MIKRDGDLVLRERGDTLTISEYRHGLLVTLLRVTSGALTRAQLMYFEANLRGQLLQEEADLILKYFYGLQ